MGAALSRHSKDTMPCLIQTLHEAKNRIGENETYIGENEKIIGGYDLLSMICRFLNHELKIARAYIYTTVLLLAGYFTLLQ